MTDDNQPDDETYLKHVKNAQDSYQSMSLEMQRRGWPNGAILEALVLYTLSAMVNNLGAADTAVRLRGLAEGLDADEAKPTIN
jgi:hypothetical protein